MKDLQPKKKIYIWKTYLAIVSQNILKNTIYIFLFYFSDESSEVLQEVFFKFERLRFLLSLGVWVPV